MDVEANNVIARPEGTSLYRTVFNGLNSILGSGILSISFALASGGWLSLICLLLIAAASCYTCFLTKRCLDNNRNIANYNDMGEAAFGKIGKVVTSIILYIDIYLMLTGYLILEGDNLHHLFPTMKINLFGIPISGKQCFVILAAVVVLPTVWLDDVRVFAYVNATGAITVLVITISVLWVALFDGIGFHNPGHQLILKWEGVTAALSLYMFAYSGNVSFVRLYNRMQNKQYFSKVIVIDFVSATVVYTSMAILGYMMYGSTVNPQITLSLPTQKTSSKIAIYMAWIAPLFKFAIFMEPIATMTESWFPTQYRANRLFRIFLRTILVLSQVVVALSIPYFRDLIELGGALFAATSSIAIPCLCYLKIFKINLKSWEGIMIIILIGFSILLSIGGTYISLKSIVTNIISSRN